MEAIFWAILYWIGLYLHICREWEPINHEPHCDTLWHFRPEFSFMVVSI